MITADRVRELLDYCPETGEFRNRISRRASPAGKLVGTMLPIGYLQIKIDRKCYYCHRLAWLYVHGVWPLEIDHIDHDRSNNRIANLRSVTHRQNLESAPVGRRIFNRPRVVGRVAFSLRNYDLDESLELDDIHNMT